MDTLFLQLFSETGIIAGLFVSTFIYFLWKGIPAIFKKFEDMSREHKAEVAENQRNFQEAFDRQRITFENTMNQVVITFNEQIQKSNDWHEKHSNNLVEIKAELRKLGK